MRTRIAALLTAALLGPSAALAYQSGPAAVRAWSYRSESAERCVIPQEVFRINGCEVHYRNTCTSDVVCSVSGGLKIYDTSEVIQVGSTGTCPDDPEETNRPPCHFFSD